MHTSCTSVKCVSFAWCPVSLCIVGTWLEQHIRWFCCWLCLIVNLDNEKLLNSWFWLIWKYQLTWIHPYTHLRLYKKCLVFVRHSGQLVLILCLLLVFLFIFRTEKDASLWSTDKLKSLLSSVLVSSVEIGELVVTFQVISFMCIRNIKTIWFELFGGSICKVISNSLSIY